MDRDSKAQKKRVRERERKRQKILFEIIFGISSGYAYVPPRLCQGELTI